MLSEKEWKAEGPFEWRLFWRAFKRGATETPRLYFEPLTPGYWRRLFRSRQTDEAAKAPAAMVSGELFLPPGVWSVGSTGIILSADARLIGCSSGSPQ